MSGIVEIPVKVDGLDEFVSSCEPLFKEFEQGDMTPNQLRAAFGGAWQERVRMTVGDGPSEPVSPPALRFALTMD